MVSRLMRTAFLTCKLAGTASRAKYLLNLIGRLFGVPIMTGISYEPDSKLHEAKQRHVIPSSMDPILFEDEPSSFISQEDQGSKSLRNRACLLGAAQEDVMQVDQARLEVEGEVCFTARIAKSFKGKGEALAYLITSPSAWLCAWTLARGSPRATYRAPESAAALLYDTELLPRASGFPHRGPCFPQLQVRVIVTAQVEGPKVAPNVMGGAHCQGYGRTLTYQQQAPTLIEHNAALRL